ncbi:MAG: nucleotidyltransferase domain-containing protein [Nanoarchaeota archaeon]
MYDKLNITETHIRVLSLFTKGFNKGFYIREVHQALGISPSTAQLILDDLEKKAVLESALRGKTKIYNLKKTWISQEYLILAEHYKTISFLEKHLKIKEFLGKIPGYLDGIALIFGSYAKDLEKEDSDLDLFIIGSCDRKKIEEAGEIYNLKVSIKNYPFKTFQENLKNDVLIREVLDNHIAVFNAEGFVRRVQNG